MSKNKSLKAVQRWYLPPDRLIYPGEFVYPDMATPKELSKAKKHGIVVEVAIPYPDQKRAGLEEE